MSDFEINDGYMMLTVWDDPQGRRVHLDMSEQDDLDPLGISLNPEQAHDLITALRNVAQRRIPDDTEDGAYEGADSAYSARMDDLTGRL